MAHDQRNRDCFSRPIVPIVNMQIGSADAGAIHSDQNIIKSNNRLGNIFEPEAGLRLSFNERFQFRLIFESETDGELYPKD